MFKAYDFALNSVSEDGQFSGYASVFDTVDLHNEVVVKGAFSKSLEKWHLCQNLPKMLWQHDAKIPIGYWLSIIEDGYGLKVQGQLLLDLQFGKEAYTLLKKKIIDKLSIGFQIKKSAICQLQGCRLLQEIDLNEISLVTFAANPLAQITAIKNEGGDALPRLSTILQKINNFNAFVSQSI